MGDYGEPWPERNDGMYVARWAYPRVRACVNACSGMSDPAKEIAELRGEIRMLKALDESAVRKRLDMERDAKTLREAAADVVSWADAIEGQTAHARCIVKRKYIDRLNEALATPTRPQGHTKETA